MPRPLNLRQIEAFKTVIEQGTVTAAAEILNISQPAMSKLIAHLEMDTGLHLFERIKGRLSPTEQGMRLYDEIDLIFAGVGQVEKVVDAIRREQQGRLLIGVMPALSGSFIKSAVMAFLAKRSDVFCSIHSESSQWIVDKLVTGQLDVGLVSLQVDNPYMMSEPVMEHPLVCLLPPNHPLTEKTHIEPQDLGTVPFVAFRSDSLTAQLTTAMFTRYKIRPNIVMVANISSILCEFISAGIGVTLAHPLTVGDVQDRLVVRPFEPKISLGFRLCYGRDGRNRKLVDQFLQETRDTAERLSRELLEHG